MSFPKVAALAVACLVAAQAATAQTRPPLRDNQPINDTLLVAAIGDQIRKNCPTISARMLVVYQRGRALHRYAKDQGYTDEEISDYLESREDNDRMKARAWRYLQSKGVRKDDAASYCRAGEAEIAEGTPVGEILRAR